MVISCQHCSDKVWSGSYWVITISLCTNSLVCLSRNMKGLMLTETLSPWLSTNTDALNSCLETHAK